jgi:hypothetical protein
MTVALIEDARSHPEAFHWNGPIRPELLRQWKDKLRFEVPFELIDIWEQFGGGELFETESLYQPLGQEGYDIEDETDQLIGQGLPLGLLVFHRGRSVSAIDQQSGGLVDVGVSGFRVLKEFANFNDWYEVTLRAEYGQRYGL